MYVFLDEISRCCEGSERPVLDRVSLHARSGEILSVVGPGGAGKSTLLQFVGERSDGDGGVFLGTDDAREPGQAKPDLVRGWLSGSPGDVSPPGWRTEERRGVAIRRYAFPSTALAGSFRDPDLLLVDDLAADPAFAAAAARRTFLRDLHGLHPRPGQRTIIYATRDGDDALAVSDRIAVLDRGRIVQAGTPADVRDRPANEFVARLFGQPPINLVPAILEKDGQAILLGNQTVSLAGRIAEEFCRDVTVGIRPRHARLHRDGAGWRGRVVSSERHGERSLVTVATEGVRVRALADEPFDAGERVVVRVLPKHFIVFDDRGVRLDQL
ncbi:MAG: TOBE domain-containing protein [Acidobacteria bacterium]|nr:TOBE domain-containing protein [Acidobacteriota bacterium]